MSRGQRFAWAPLLVLGAVLLALVAWGSLYVIDEREQAVILQLGKPVKSVTEPGLYVKLPLIQEVRRLPRTLQFWQSEEDIMDLPTADGKKVEVAAWALWRITDPLKFVQVLRTVESGDRAVQDRVRAAIRDEITRYSLAEVVRSTDRELTYSFRFELPDLSLSDGQADTPAPAPQPIQPGELEKIEVGREKIMEGIKETVRRRLAGQEEEEIDRGVELVDVGLSSLGFVPAVREAAFERLKAFMESIAAGYYSSGEQRKQEIINRTQAEVEKILGEGEQLSRITRGQVDAENIDEFAKAMNDTEDLYEFLKTLEIYEKSLGDRTQLILTTDSELFRLLDSMQPAAP